MQLDFRALNIVEFQELVQWASQEGWDPGLNDASIFFESYPTSFYGYFLNEQLIAGGSIVSYDGEFGFMGFFIVHPEHRGKGIGESLWLKRRDLLRRKLKPGATIGMDGVLAMQQFYAKGGFSHAFRDERRVRLGQVFSIDKTIRKIDSSTAIHEVLAYDKMCFGFNRADFMTKWLLDSQAISFTAVNDHGELTGFAVMRKTEAGWKIGPLFSDTIVSAENLYKACLNEVPNEKVFLDIPLINEDAVQLAHKYNTAYVFECARMYLGNPPNIPMTKLFGITSFELG
jgi:GNAT superfamily N-acetyltransferase